MDKILNLKNLAGIEPFSSRFARLHDLYILTRIDTESVKSADNDKTVLLGFNTPFRLDGLLFLINEKGDIELQTNTEQYTLGSNDIVIVRPGTLFTFNSIQAPASMTLLFLSTTFLNSLNIDLSSLEIHSIVMHQNPLIRLSKTQSDIMRKYFDLLQQNADKSNIGPFATRIARMLISAMTYEILNFAITEREEIQTSHSNAENEMTTRIQSYVYRFLHLLHIHFARHRNIEFYARELCITPKYLSMITKQLTGNTAAEWLTRVTILEAKNMLRFSDKTIQQVAYDLNFPSQSAFGKYFKRLTGMSPRDYLRSSIK